MLQPGASVAVVADRHGVARGLIYQWLRPAREGRTPGCRSTIPKQSVEVVPADQPRAHGPARWRWRACGWPPAYRRLCAPVSEAHWRSASSGALAADPWHTPKQPVGRSPS
ncbi:MAG TPA: hypothetical protein VFZ16_20915 [Hyphomicrobiaceae bacterium]|nr:hypothetical protein [Hyphomicrobiaceae bacterium]